MSSAAGVRRCAIGLAVPPGEDNVQVRRSRPARKFH